MNSESLRISNQLHQAFSGDPWHGSPLRDLLAGVTAAQALAHPLPQAHSIWELVLHIHVYVQIAFEATEGVPMPKLFETGKDWLTVADGSATAWTGATDRLFQGAQRLADAIKEFDNERLQDTVPGREYDFYYLFHGIVQHSL